ncbi:MAG: ABC transporter ATP-binding protein [Candidatus Saccharimonadales bacterium]
MAIIELHDVSKLYGFGDATTLALDEINLSVLESEFIAIMGPSGSGKSTLMNIIGLLDRPTYGSYTLSNRSVAKLRPNQQARIRRDKIGFVFQSYNLLPKLTVIDNVALPLAYRGVSAVRRLKLASAMLERIGLAERQYFMPRQLSGGQTQSVAIARALINNPAIIIADEPTGNLDSDSSLLIMELLSEIHKMGTTILLVTHNAELTRYATRVLFMSDGAIVHEEQTNLGELAPIFRRNIYGITVKTEDDDLAGVSALMKAIPAIEVPSTKKPRKPSNHWNKKTNTGRRRS